MHRPAPSLARRFHADFSDGIRRRGELYAATGGVSVVEAAADVFRGVIEGASVAEASLRVGYDGDGPELSMHCNCPYFEASPCKHLWALVLAADEQGWGKDLADDAGTETSRDGSAHDNHDHNDDDEVEDDRAAPTVWATRSRGQLPASSARPDWRNLLANLDIVTAAEHGSRSARDSATGDADRECWLVINTGESLAKQQLHLDCMDRRLKLNGGWGIFKPASCTVDDLLPRRAHGRSSVLGPLLNATAASYRKAPYGRREATVPRRFESLTLDPGMDRGLWRAIGAEVRIAVASQSATGRQILPATFDEASLWTDELDVRRAGNGRDWTLSLQLRRDDGTAVRSDEPLVVFPSGLVIFKDALAWMRARSPDEFQWISLLRRSPRMAVPDEQLDTLTAKILKLQTPPRINWSEDAIREQRAWTEESPVPVPILRLSRGVLSKKPGGVVALSVAFAYGPHRIDGDDPREVLAVERYRHILRRDLRGESRHLERLVELSEHRAELGDPGSLTVPMDALVAIIERIETDGWEVELEGVRVRSATNSTAHVSSGIDWFDLQADCRFSDQVVRLPALLAAIEAQSPFVRLDDGSVGMMPSAWIQRLTALSQFGRTKDGALRFDKSQIAILDVLLDDLPDVGGDELFADLRRKMRRFDRITPAEPPAAFVGSLRPYQKDGLGWLRFLQEFQLGGCLADDMGLGKTIQVLAALPVGAEPKRPSLVVVPRSLVHNWRSEAAKFRPDLRALIYDECNRKSVETVVPAYDLVIITYGCLRRDITRLRKLDFEWAVLDEAQTIKNRDSQTARASRLLQARFRLALSGTPVENRVEELISIFDFLNPGMITPSMFRRIKVRNKSENALYQLLGKALRPFILRRTKAQVLTDLPEKTEQTIFCELESGQREKYEELRRHYQTHLMETVEQDGLDRSKFHVLEALLRLRQAACHPGLLDEARTGETSAKLDALVEQLVDVVESGHKALVFSQFTSLLAIVRGRLEREGIAYEYLDGQTRNREGRVRRFQSDATVPVFLISIKAGGVGLNLTAAEYCFILDPWWNPAVEAQAVARAHRIGQTKPVFAYRLIARGTVEEKILELQARKRGLADAIVTADNASLGKMSLDDLRFLLA